MVAAIAVPVPVAIAVGGLLGSAILGRRRRRWSGHQAAAAGLWGGDVDVLFGTGTVHWPTERVAGRRGRQE